MKTLRNLKVAIAAVVAVFSVTSVFAADTSVGIPVKDKSSNVAPGRSVADTLESAAKAQDVVDLKNAIGEFAANVDDKQGKIEVPDEPQLTDFSFLVNDPTRPTYGGGIWVEVSGSVIKTSNIVFTTWPVLNYFDVSTGAARQSAGYSSSSWQPYQSGYTNELQYQIYIVDKGIQLYGVSYTDKAALANLVKVKECLQYYVYKYGNFSASNVNKKGNGTIVTRTDGIVTVTNLINNMATGSFKIDLKTGTVTAIGRNGNTTVVTGMMRLVALQIIINSVKNVKSAQADTGKYISSAMLLQQIRSLR